MTKYKVELNSYNKDTYKQIEGAWAYMIYVNSIEEAQQVVKDYIKKHNLKIDNWVGGNFWTEENEYIGYISYDGCFWDKDHENGELKLRF